MENKSFEAMLAMRNSGHVDRDANGNDITYLNYLKHRRRECKEKGIPYDAAAEMEWFRKNWNDKPKGRKPKGKEARKSVTFRLQPSTIDTIRMRAAERGISQSDFVEFLAGNSELLHNADNGGTTTINEPTS